MASGRAVALACAALAMLLVASPAGAFYLPGVAPRAYDDGEEVEIKAVKLTSVQRPLPYQYYHLPFCRPQKMRFRKINLGLKGEALRGDRISNTPYKLAMNKPVDCRLVCRGSSSMEQLYSKKQIKQFERFIKANYRANWLMDNLPAATRITGAEGDSLAHGFPLGYVDKDKVTHLFNHVIIIGRVHATEETSNRIVGFEIKTRSLHPSRYSQEGSDPMLCQVAAPKTKEESTLVLDSSKMGDSDKAKIIWSYSVFWEPSPVAWASRWDTYLKMDDAQIHWFSIINSLVTVVFLTGILAFIIVRTLRRDIAKYNEEDEEEIMEQTGWKLVHGDVFRPPPHTFWFCVLVGSGSQLFWMALVTIVFSMFGMLSPASRGSLMTATVLLYMFMGVVAGFYGSRMYKTLGGQDWKKAATATALFYPGIVFGTGFILNFFVWGSQSSGAIPFGTMVALLVLWLGISTPLVFGGYYFGYRMEPYKSPVKTNQIPRQIPEQMWYMHPLVSMMLGGILPFGAVFIELFFILTAIWENQVYYLFGFLFLVFIILIVSCSEIAIVMTYLQLCSEDYRWWWRSFLVSGGCAIYVFLYATFYFVTKLEITDGVSTLLYFGYTLMMCFTFFLLTATMGFYTTFRFVRIIYNSIKID